MRRLSIIAAVGLLTLAVSHPSEATAVGRYTALVTPTVAAELGEPADLAVALDGDIFVADAANGRVAVVRDGVVVRDWDGSEGPGPELRRPTGICIGPDDLVYVADVQGDRVLVYKRTGEFVRTVGSSGAADGRLSGPSDVVADNSGVWVADTFNDRVQRFSLTGVWVRTVGGGVSQMFSRPVSLDLYNGLVYVSEAVGVRGQAFNATTYATAIAPWGITDSGGGVYVSRYLRPAGIDVDASARLFLADAGRGVVEQMTATSVLTSQTVGGMGGGLAQPAGVLSRGDTLYVADSLNDRVARYSFTATAWVSPITPSGSEALGRFLEPAAVIEESGSGDLIVAERGTDRVQRIDASGVFVGVFDTTGPGALDAPAGLVQIGTEVFVSDSGNHRIQVYDLSGTYLRTLGGPGSGEGQYSQPTALAVTPGGDLAVADTGNNRVQVVTTSGGFVRTLAAGLVTGPQGVAVDAAGIVYVADTGGHRIRVFSADGAPTATWGTFGPANGQLSAPRGLALDPVTGELVVADSGNHRLVTFTPTGGFVSVTGSRGTSAGEYRDVRAVSIGPDRSMAIADSGNHRVQRLAHDDVAPVTTASGVPASWVNTTVSISLTATDAASGVAATYYRIGTGADTTYTAPVTISSQGTTTIRYWSVDRTGNVESMKTATVRIDTVAPSGVMVIAGGASLVGTRTVSVDSTVTDAVTMSVDTGAGFGSRIAYAPRVAATLPARDGTHTVTVRYYDALDNPLVLSDQVAADLTAPAVGLVRTPAGAITSRPVDITLSASDAVAGVVGRFISIDSAAEQPYTDSAVRVDSEGMHVVVGSAVDGVGNRGSVATTFTIDRTGPDTRASGVMPGGLSATPVSITLEAHDALGAVAGTTYSLDGGALAEYAGPFTVIAEGTHTVTFSSVDSVGNIGATGALTFTVDRTAPTVSAEGAVHGAYRAGEATIALSAADAVTGVELIRYSIDGGGYLDYSEPFVVSGDGAHSVAYQARDRAGNWSDLGHLSFIIDPRVPAGYVVAGRGAHFVGSTTVSIANFVVGATEMRFDTGGGFGDWSPFADTATVELTGEGRHTIIGEYRSLAGLSTQLSDVLTVDMSAPVVGVPTITPHELSFTVMRPRFRLGATWEAYDPGIIPSGIAAYRVLLGANSYAPVEPTLDLGMVDSGIHTLRANATDFVGNTSPAAVTAVEIGDGRSQSALTPPSVTMSPLSRSARVIALGVTRAPGERVVIRAYKRDALGRWMLVRTVGMRAARTSSGSGLVGIVRVSPGLWRYVVEVSGPGTYRLGTPSAAVTVR